LENKICLYNFRGMKNVENRPFPTDQESDFMEVQEEKSIEVIFVKNIPVIGIINKSELLGHIEPMYAQIAYCDMMCTLFQN